MLFRFFVLSGNVEKTIKRAGFSVHSYSEDSVYCGLSVEVSVSSPDEYCLDGEIWKRIDATCLGVRAYCLAKTPFLAFEELMNVLMEAKCRDDRLGAAVFMFINHYALLHERYKMLLAFKNPNKAAKTALNTLSSLFQNA